MPQIKTWPEDSGTASLETRAWGSWGKGRLCRAKDTRTHAGDALARLRIFSQTDDRHESVDSSSNMVVCAVRWFGTKIIDKSVMKP